MWMLSPDCFWKNFYFLMLVQIWYYLAVPTSKIKSDTTVFCVNACVKGLLTDKAEKDILCLRLLCFVWLPADKWRSRQEIPRNLVLILDKKCCITRENQTLEKKWKIYTFILKWCQRRPRLLFYSSKIKLSREKRV